MSSKNLFVLVIFSLSFLTAAAARQPAAYLTEPALSPDRREIVFVSGGDIWTVPAAGGTASLLISHPATESRPKFSPDGKRVAFVSTRTGGGDIYVLNLDGGDLSRITFDDSLDNLDAWSRDGKWLYFSSASRDIAGMNDVYRISANGGTAMTVSNDRYTSEFFAAPAPGGDSFAFSARGIGGAQWWRKGRSHIDESEIWMKTGDAYEQLTTGGAKQLWTMWSADGSRIYYVSDRDGAQNIWTKPLKGQEKQLTNFRDGRVLWANISDDGRQIVFERDFKIWSLETSGGKAAEVPIILRGTAAGAPTDKLNLSGQIRELALAPDGKKVALIARGELFAASSKDGGDAVKLTDTPAPESFAAWSPDSRKIVYVSERDGARQIFQYDFGTETETQLTRGGNDFSPVYAPDGKSIAFIRDARALWIYDVSSGRERRLCGLFTDAPPIGGRQNFAWSPDGKMLAFLTNAPENRSYVNVSVVAAGGGEEPKPISFLSNSNSNSVSWSPDGTFVLFDTGQRTEDGALAQVDLTLRTPKFREDQFRDLFRQENPQQKPQPTPTPAVNPAGAPTPAVSPTPTPAVNPTPADLVKSDAADADRKKDIVFENIRRRLRLLPTGVNVNGQTVSPDGKTVLLLAAAEGQFNLYTMPLDELATETSAKQITSTPNFKSDAQFSPDSKEVYYIENGRVQIVNLERGAVRSLAVNLETNANFAAEKMEIFKQGWRFLRDNFYDEKYHSADWNAVEKTYEPLIAGAKNIDETRRLMSLMVGELNASHLGVTGANGFTPTPIGKLGLRFDRAEYETAGRLKITEIIALGPADITREIKPGDYLLSVGGVKIDASKNLDELLENKVGKRVEIEIAPSGDASKKREIVLKPISTATEKNLLYRQWVETNRAYVERTSGGKLGYVHLPDMSSDSLNQLYIDLDAENQARRGVVVDIRNNNGGFVNPYVIDVLSRRGYLTMRERGLWNVPARSALGQRALERPTILITNQHSLSDAEDLTEGYRSLKIGKVVGEPTAGWIIFTWNAATFDGTTVRLPRQLITGGDGKDMEMNPRQVDIAVTRPIGESLIGRDSQLDAAVKELLTETER